MAATKGRRTLPPHLHAAHGQALLTVQAVDSSGRTFRLDCYVDLTRLAVQAHRAIASLEEAEAVLGNAAQQLGLAYGETRLGGGAFLLRVTRARPAGRRARVGKLELTPVVAGAEVAAQPVESW